MEKYYYLDANSQQQGPVEASELTRFGVSSTTLVWKQGMETWQQAGMIPELSWIFPPSMPAGSPPPPPFSGTTPPPYASANVPQANLNYIPQKPDNLLVWSILATVLCCVPSGIVAIIYSSRVNSLWDIKDYAGANNAAKNAKTWCFISLGLGIVVFILAFIGGFLGALSQ
jgi:hypothetical protein